VRVSGIGTLALTFLLLAAAVGRAQVAPPRTAPMPPPPGFVPPYEIMHTLRSAGFDPLAPPLREGATYVVRANDYRGILMRVVVDARTGAIRDANRILPGPGSDMRLGMLPPYEASPDIMPPPDFAPKPAPAATVFPPLPRPRPAELAARATDIVKPDGVAPPAAQPDSKADVRNAILPASAAPAPAAASAPARAGKTAPPLLINN
jgi:hypothetical protein